MKRAKRILAALLALLLLSACTETPKEDIVTNKGESVLENKIENSTGVLSDLPEQGSSLESYSFTSRDGAVDYKFPGTVALPENNSLPVLQVTPHFFTSEEVERIAHVLCGDSEIYTYSTAYTKQEIEEKILELRRSLDPETLFEQTGGNEEEMERITRAREKLIEQWEALYEQTDDSFTLEISDFQYHPDSYWYTGSTKMGIDGVDSIKCTSTVAEIPIVINASLRNDDSYRLSNFYSEMGDPKSPQRSYSYLQTEKITDQEAEAWIDAASRQIAEMDIGQWLCDSYKIASYDDQGTMRYSIVSIWCPVFEGIKVVDVGNLPSLKTDDAYAANYYYPEMRMEMSYGKILSFSYYSPHEVVSVLNNSVETLPFAEIMDRIKQQLEFTYTARSISEAFIGDLDNLPEGMTYTIPEKSVVIVKRIELGLVRIRIPDNEQDYYYIPAWVVKGLFIPGTEENVDEGFLSQNLVLLCINAIDGSVIDVTKGY